MSTVAAPSVFESFNARNLSPRQVAQGFIPPRHFEDLVLRRHSLVVGPRGSGKTTLLKMLQLPALAAWHHPEADRYRRSIDFTGVFVPADVSWGAQLSAIGGRRLSQETANVLGMSAFTAHVLIAVADAMHECASGADRAPASLSDKYVRMSKEHEVDLCRLLASNWKVNPVIPSFHGVKLALRDRLSEIAQLARRMAVSTDVDPLSILTDFNFLGFIESTTFAIEAFNGITNAPDRRWALLFDELEIAPAEIRQALFGALRSTDQRLLFKLSISPYHQDATVLKGSKSAMAGQDYQPIELWYPRKEEGYRFSEALMDSMLSDLGIEGASSEQVFGPSFFDGGDSEQINKQVSYRPGSTLHRRFISLAAKDPSFRAYLARAGVNLDEMHLLSENQRASSVRKGTSVVAVRDHYRSKPELAGAPTRVERSRKTPTLYTGNRSLFAIIEGNPRWFIGVVGPMLRRYRDTGKRVPRSEQAKTITTATNRFRALLRTIPYTPASSAGSRGLLSLLDTMGDAFHENLVGGEFNPDPPLSFIVDSNTSRELLEALGRALNAGAVVLASEPGSDALLSSLRGKRFRLSYMLAPGYGLPLTLGRPIALSQVGDRSRRSDSQLNLLGDDEKDSSN